jgi:hypothetical protein
MLKVLYEESSDATGAMSVNSSLLDERSDDRAVTTVEPAT